MQQTYLLITIVAAIAALAVMFAAPKPFVRLLWLVLFCYPHALTAGLLPLNMGMDDIYILALGIVVITRRVFSRKFYFGFASIAAILFWVINSCSDLTGAFTGPAILWESAIKAVLKGFVYVVFAVIMDNTLTDETEIKRTLNWILFAGLCGAITVIGQHYYEPLFQIFTLYRPEIWQQSNVRGGGAFLDPNAGGIMMMIFLLLAMTKLGTGGLIKSKPFTIFMCAVFISALAVSQSRSAMLGMAAAAFVLALFSPFRRYAIIVGIIAIPLFMYSQFSALISERFLHAGEAATDRKEIWLTIMQNPSPFIAFCGRGASAEFERLQATPHNTYIHILFELGFMGAIWAIWFFRRIVKSALILNKSQNNDFRVWGNWCLYSLVGMAVAAMAMEMLFISFVKYIFFLMAAISYKCRFLKEQQDYIFEQYCIDEAYA